MSEITDEKTVRDMTDARSCKLSTELNTPSKRLSRPGMRNVRKHTFLLREERRRKGCFRRLGMRG